MKPVGHMFVFLLIEQFPDQVSEAGPNKFSSVGSYILFGRLVVIAPVDVLNNICLLTLNLNVFGESGIV